MGTYVRPSGDLQTAKIIIVGEQPGQTEIQTGRPFCGPAGRELDSCLTAVGISRTDCYFTNYAKDLDKHVSEYLNLKTKTYSEKGKQYLSTLLSEMKQANTPAIIAMGNYAMTALTGITSPGVTKWRGSVLENPELPGKYIIPTIHTSTILPPEMQYLNKFLIQLDLKRAKQISEGGFQRKRRELIIAPTYYDSLQYLRKCFAAGMKGEIVYFDIELYNEEVSCISFAIQDDEGISIPFVHNSGDYFSIEQELEVWKAIAHILEKPEIRKCGQNVSFDSHFLLRRYGIKSKNLEDTMIAQRTLMPDYPIGLDFITSIWTDQPYYKDEGKKYFSGGGWEQLWRYNTTDSLMCAEAFPKQVEKLTANDNYETYHQQSRLVPPLVYMQERGIKVDIDGMKAKAQEYELEIVELRKELNLLAGRVLNANSPKQLKDYFYGELKFKPYKNRQTGGDSTDNLAMKRLSRQGVKEARVIQNIRKNRKLVSTYMNPAKFDKDNRIRCSFNPAGTRYSRLSSSSNIFGTGMNLQNWPHSLHRYLLFDEGYVGYRIDLSQAENRIVAYVGNVIPMIECFERGDDVHSLTASLIFSKPPKEISREPGSCSLGDGTQDERFWGKKANHCKLKTCEVLTPKGWVTIDEAYINNYEIAQWNKLDESITFITPSKWFVSNYSGEIHTIHNERIFQEATPEHRMPVYYDRKIKDMKISKYPKSGKYGAPLSGFFSGLYMLPDCAIKLLVAFQADGCWNGNSMTFKLHKERKIKRLIRILKTGEIPFTHPTHGYITISSKHSISIFAKKFMGRDKNFGGWLLSLSGETLDSFLDELPHWDGYLIRNMYFTTSRNNIEWAQIISHLRGRAANIIEQDNSKSNSFGNKMLYKLNIHNNTRPATHAINHIKRTVNNETIFCPTVPTGYFVVRENNKISITGNSLNYDLGFRAFALIYEMPENQAKFIVDRYHLAYPGVRNNYHQMVRSQLKANRTVTNLMGRKTLFMDQWGDKLFKEAYSCIPQGTVGDVINKRGINYIYFREQEFEPVELLLQVHDDITFQIPISTGYDYHAEALLKIKKELETPLVTPDGREFIVPADVTVCPRSFDKEQGTELKGKNFPSDPKALAEKLKTIVESFQG